MEHEAIGGRRRTAGQAVPYLLLPRPPLVQTLLSCMPCSSSPGHLFIARQRLLAKYERKAGRRSDRSGRDSAAGVRREDETDGAWLMRVGLHALVQDEEAKDTAHLFIKWASYLGGMGV